MSLERSKNSGAVPQDLVQLGHVMSAFGVQGWVKIRPYTDGVQTLTQAKQWWFQASTHTPQGSQPSPEGFFVLPIQQARAHGNTIIAQPQGYHDRDQAQALRGHGVWLSRADFAPLAPDEFYWVDLIGCLVYGLGPDSDQHDGSQQLLDPQGDAQSDSKNDSPSTASELIGRVSNVFDNGAHAVLVVDRGQLHEQVFQPELDQKNRPQQSLIPFVEAYVNDVDLPQQRIETSWPTDF